MKPRLDDSAFMRLALEEAAKAPEHNDVPVGALAVLNGEIIGKGHNRREIDHDPTAHAEILAIREAAQHLNHWRLDGVTLYCTLEPCPMCAGAMVLARLPRLVCATIDLKGGAGGSLMDIVRHPLLNHRVEVDYGILADDATTQLQAFFARLRKK